MSSIKNSEILFLYDAKMSNPNGDMDDENKPRMDKHTKTNLVSDVRLKRYVRDYLYDFKGEDIWLIQTDESKDAKERWKEIGENVEDAKNLIDVRLFGAVFTDANAGTLTGPIQFNWGYSLNRVELIKSNTITSHFKTSGDSDSKGGAGIGKDHRVKYSLLAFAGSINSKNAEKTGLTQEDMSLFDEAMIKSIPLNRTRSKIGQSPRLYLRAELDEDAFLNDLRDLISLEEEELEGIDEARIEVKELIEYLKENKSSIQKFKFWKDKKLVTVMDGKECSLKKELEKIGDMEDV